MSGLRAYLKQISLAMIVALSLATTFSTVAHAGMIGTGELIQQEQTNLDRQQLLSMLEKQEVQDKLAQFGVSTDQVAERIHNLTPAELAEFEQQLAQAPAGEGIVGVVVLLFLVFVVTDMLCATDIFPFVRCVR